MQTLGGLLIVIAEQQRSEATVRLHLVHAFTKLDVDDRPAAVTVD